MQKHRRKIILVLIILALGGIVYATHLDRAGDCLFQGGQWNGDFCRIDHAPSPLAH